MLQGPVHDEMAGLVTAQLLFLEAEDPERAISLYINSPGGERHRRFSHLRHDAVHPSARRHAVLGPGGVDGVLALGCAAALPNAQVMLHRPVPVSLSRRVDGASPRWR